MGQWRAETWGRRWGGAALMLAIALGCASCVGRGELSAEPEASASLAPPPTLTFVRGDTAANVLSLSAILGMCAPERVEVDDPYYERSKRFWACPLADVLAQGFGVGGGRLASEHFFLRALDGYTRPADGGELLAAGGWLALADADVVLSLAELASAAETGRKRFEAIDRRQVDPSPFYVVWSLPGQSDTHRWPWPYQLAELQIAPFESRFPHTAPRGEAPDSAAARGYTLFKRQCVSCHSINGEGGKVGPELNVPMSIIEYREPAQLRAFIREPGKFRYTSMPSHLGLGDDDLDDLLAYFRAMSVRKYDPR